MPCKHKWLFSLQQTGWEAGGAAARPAAGGSPHRRRRSGGECGARLDVPHAGHAIISRRGQLPRGCRVPGQPEAASAVALQGEEGAERGRGAASRALRRAGPIRPLRCARRCRPCGCGLQPVGRTRHSSAAARCGLCVCVPCGQRERLWEGGSGMTADALGPRTSPEQVHCWAVAACRHQARVLGHGTGAVHVVLPVWYGLRREAMGRWGSPCVCCARGGGESPRLRRAVPACTHLDAVKSWRLLPLWACISVLRGRQLGMVQEQAVWLLATCCLRAQEQAQPSSQVDGFDGRAGPQGLALDEERVQATGQL